jgi:hypothetical protein
MFSISKIRTKLKAGEQSSISRNHRENYEKMDKKSDEQERNPTGTNKTPKKGDQTSIEVLNPVTNACWMTNRIPL